MIEQALQNTLGFGVKDFIEKAIEGGWIYHGVYEHMPVTFTIETGHLYYIEFKYGDHTPIEYAVGEFLLLPQAWKAVGKTEGWKDPSYAQDNSKHVHYHHRFIDELYKLSEDND